MTDSPAPALLPSRRALLGAGLGLGAAAALGRPARAGDEAAPLLVYAVRHAEKAGGEDPALTEAGSARAAELARVLGKVELTAVWSTDTRRTRDTAGPVAEAHGLKVQLYEPAQLPAALQGKTGAVLVVGHSNTTPALVRGLGASFATEELEGYEDLLLTVVLPGGKGLLQHLRYGAPSAGGGH